ncbi:MAG: NADH-quinone oxidoreductase subunit C [Bilophila sp.]
MPPSVARLVAEPITLETVRSVAQANFDAGYRFVTLSVVNLGNGNLDIIYHYDKNLTMRHYRVTVPIGQNVPSISDIYFCAMLIENESRDQYGIIWDGLIIDFEGSLYLEKDTPPPLLRGPSCTISTVSKK